MAINYPALKTELQTDPAALGYAPHVASGNAQGLADIMNWPRNGTTASPVNAVVGAAITIRRPDISPNEVLEAIDSRDFIASPGIAHVAWFESVTQLRSMRLVDDAGVDTRVLGNLKRIVNNTPQGSQSRLNTLASRVGSRTEQLFGAGIELTHSDIGTALGLP